MNRRLWALSLALVFVLSTTALANPHYKVELFGDASQSTCTIDAHNPGPVSVHVFHTGLEPSSGLLFSVYLPDCWPGASWLGDELAEPWVTIGNTQVPLGLSIGYGECRPLPLYIGKINFFAPGGTAPCCELKVTHPTSWTYYTEPTLATDCLFVEWAGPGGRVIVNADAGCPCTQPLATHSSTWGKVKALYR